MARLMLMMSVGRSSERYQDLLLSIRASIGLLRNAFDLNRSCFTCLTQNGVICMRKFVLNLDL
ncbi:MAG: hypothetical protein Q8M40_02205, partial [Legionella sp.]|nr:hypothetical protein [Legionella sp.]